MALVCTMILGDCLEVMPTLPAEENNVFIADLPFGATPYRWDAPVCLKRFWACVGSSTTIAFANLPFMRVLIDSNEKYFRHELIWDQMRGWTPLLAKRMPMRAHHFICIFGGSSVKYSPQKTSGHSRVRAIDGCSRNEFYGREKKGYLYDSTQRYPTSVLRIPADKKTRNNTKGTRNYVATHPSAKPVALLSWLISSYASPENVIVDPTAGSGSTAVAAIGLGKSVVCIEKDQGYFDASVERVQKTIRDGNLDVALEVRR